MPRSSRKFTRTANGWRRSEHCASYYHSFADKYASGNFRADALPNSDIIAYVRHTGKNGFCLVVVWAGQDQVRAPPAQLQTVANEAIQ